MYVVTNLISLVSASTKLITYSPFHRSLICKSVEIDLLCPHFNLQHVEGENSMVKKNATALSGVIWFSISFHDLGIH